LPLKDIETQDLGSPNRSLITAPVLCGLLALLIIGLLIRLHFISRAMRYDEAWTVLHYALRPLHVAISSYTAPNNHIFHTLLVHTAFVLLGNKPYILRLPALLAGLALIPVSYLFGAIVSCRATGLMTAAVVTLSAPLVEYSVNA
jgi:hypothetical protein